ncbi:MAG: prepilin peptidase [archaeon]
MFFLYFFLISFIGLIIASYTDLRNRIISNKLTYSMILLGLGLHLVQTLVEGNPEPIMFSVLLTIITFTAGLGLWFMGAWAGGDVKIFTALAALNPLNPAILSELIPLFARIELPVFPLTLFLFSIICMLPYGALLSLKAIKKKKELRQELKLELKARFLQAIPLGLIAAGLYFVLSNLNLPGLMVTVLFIVILFSLKWFKRVFIPVSIILFLIALFFQPVESIVSATSTIIVVFCLYVLLKFYFISKKHVLREKVKVSELKEGTIISKSLYNVKGKIVASDGLSFSGMLKLLKEKNLSLLKPKGKILIDSNRAAGIEEKEVKLLKKLAREKKISKEIEVKLSAPFAPAVLIAFLLLSLIGDVLWVVIF